MAPLSLEINMLSIFLHGPVTVGPFHGSGFFKYYRTFQHAETQILYFYLNSYINSHNVKFITFIFYEDALAETFISIFTLNKFNQA